VIRTGMRDFVSSVLAKTWMFRWDQAPVGNLSFVDIQQGEFPRTMSMFRTSYSVVNQARKHVPNILSLTWICQYAPDSSTYTPVYVSSDLLPLPFIRGAMQQYNTESAWYNVFNLYEKFYRDTINVGGISRLLAITQLGSTSMPCSQCDNSKVLSRPPYLRELRPLSLR
jgi:hypothetical protein